MTRHIFVVPHARAQERWQQAFVGARVVGGPDEALAETGADCVLWADVTAPGWVASLAQARPDIPVVAISLNPSPEEGLAAFEAGARGYCHALAAPAMLQQVALVVRNGGLWVGAELMSRATTAIGQIVNPGKPDGAEAVLRQLTAREQAVALQVADGASNKEIAQNLDITPRTVKAHLSAIFDKLGVRDRLQMVLKLRRSDSTVH